MNKLLLLCALVLCFICTTSMQDDGDADITFDTMVHDFGKISKGASVRCEFKFKNSGKGRLFLTSGTAECLCVKVDGPRFPLSPGERGAVKVVFDATTVGNFVKTLTVTTNVPGKHQSVTLTVKGTVKAR